MKELIGRKIDSYEVEALLGSGGMGAVYRAYDLNLNRPVALKVMYPQYAAEPEFQQRFRQEAQTAARLGDHASIIDIHNFGSYDDLTYIVMSLIPGPSLKATIERAHAQNQVIVLREALLILAQVADALGFAHRQGVIHRDVKPGNVLLRPLAEPDRPGDVPVRAVVTDFGLAKLAEGGFQTQSGALLGTLAYMSPEQCLGLDLDGRSDLYSLGVMLYLVVTGRLPFEIKSPTDAVVKHSREEPPAPESIRPGLPPSVITLLRKAMAKRPGDRFASGETLAAALRSTAADLTEAEITRFASPESTMSLTTQLPSAVDAAQPSRAGIDLTAMATQGRIVVSRSGQAARSVPLATTPLAIGRTAENDIVLDVEGISRAHARVEPAPDGDWRIVDLGSTNGTFLEGRRLDPQESVAWASGQTVRIGPYFLRLEAITPPRAADTRVAKLKPGPIISLEPGSLAVTPGEAARLTIRITNPASSAEYLAVEVEGLPEGWLDSPPDPIQVLPGVSGTLTLAVKLPRGPESVAGLHTFQVTVRSVTAPELVGRARGQLLVQPFEALAATLRPNTLSGNGICRVLVRNTGNVEATYRIHAADPEARFTFDPSGGRIRLAPGAADGINLSVAAAGRKLVGRRRNYPFEVQVGTATGQAERLFGEATIRPLIPAWVIPLLVLVLVLFCFGASALLTFIGGRDAVATRTAQAATAEQVAARATMEAVEAGASQSTVQAAGTATAGALTATAAAETAQAEGDDDDDGLSNLREETEGTDPQNPDSDDDGLTDGQELNQFGTDPLNADTDADGLEDGVEVEVQQTSPLNPDTDGDGVSDGQEVADGSNPLLPPTATPTPTSTPTASATPTPSVTPSVTPTSSPTPVVVAFASFPGGSPINEDRVLAGNEFLSAGVLLGTEPLGGHCPGATAVAVRLAGTYSGVAFNFLTSALPDDPGACNTVPVEIRFATPVRQVLIRFAGADEEYTMNVFTEQGQLIGAVSETAVQSGGLAQVSFATESANIGRVTFGRSTSLTAVESITFHP